jgi:acyl dehydratase
MDDVLFMALDLSLINQPSAPETFVYTWHDVALYALGVGAKREELDLLYEGRGPKVIPSFAVVPMFKPMFDRIAKLGGDLSMVVHGGQKVVVKKPFQPSGTLTTIATISGIYDMRKFAVVHIKTTTQDHAGELVAETISAIIFRGEGGFGGSTPPKDEEGFKVPKEEPLVQPNFRFEEKTSHEQALLYRLSGDVNPLHADPKFAADVGFVQGPILHGLCTYGFMARHAILGACAAEPARLLAVSAQFRKPVWPGDTLVTEGFIVGPGQLAMRVSVKERDEAVLGTAWASFAV